MVPPEASVATSSTPAALPSGMLRPGVTQMMFCVVNETAADAAPAPQELSADTRQ